MRKSRKQEHIENYLKTTYKGSNLFEDVFLYHNAICELNYDEVDTSVNFLGKQISFPFMINAVTGGNDYAMEINHDLAKLAAEFQIPIAVGSQKIAIDDREAEESFKVVNTYAKDTLIIANLGALSTIEEAKKAVEMINADALQLHLNLAQELVMLEGDRDFRNLLSNIEEIVKSLNVPVIVKETGCGISGEVAQKLYDAGVRIIDISGFGGTNFIEIEDLRNPQIDVTELYGWGIPTALSLLEIKSLEKEDLTIISSGGIKTATEIAKSIVMGADLCAVSGEIINYLIRGGFEMTREYIESFRKKFKLLMMFQGAKSVSDLKNCDYKITGRLKELNQK